MMVPVGQPCYATSRHGSRRSGPTPRSTDPPRGVSAIRGASLMRVFVTGGAGFIGEAVVRRLMARGDRVTAVVRDPSNAEELEEMGVELRQGDLSRTAAIVDAMRGAEAAIHLAGMYR